MGPVKGTRRRSGGAAAPPVCVARPGAARADRRHRAWRRRARRARRFSPSTSTAIVRELVDARGRRRDAPVAVCAIGGYGRRSQFLHSDIDLLIVFGGPIGRPEERFVKALLHPLWDLRFQVGHHVREFADFDRLDTDNPEYLLALMDLRAARRRPRSPRSARGRHANRRGPEWRPQILDALVTLTDQRHSEFYDTLYQLEPDVKDGPGALARRLGDADDAAARRRSPAASARSVAGSIERRRRISHAHPLGTPPRHGPQRERAELRAAGKGRRAAALHRARTCAAASKR